MYGTQHPHGIVNLTSFSMVPQERPTAAKFLSRWNLSNPSSPRSTSTPHSFLIFLGARTTGHPFPVGNLLQNPPSQLVVRPSPMLHDHSFDGPTNSEVRLLMPTPPVEHPSPGRAAFGVRSSRCGSNSYGLRDISQDGRQQRRCVVEASGVIGENDARREAVGAGNTIHFLRVYTGLLSILCRLIKSTTNLLAFLAITAQSLGSSQGSSKSSLKVPTLTLQTPKSRYSIRAVWSLRTRSSIPFLLKQRPVSPEPDGLPRDFIRNAPQMRLATPSRVCRSRRFGFLTTSNGRI